MIQSKIYMNNGQFVYSCLSIGEVRSYVAGGKSGVIPGYTDEQKTAMVQINVLSICYWMAVL